MQLNAYQRAIMQTIFDIDQALAQQHTATSPQDRRVPKSEWRWMSYATIDGDDSPLKAAFRRANLIHHGLLLTLESLNERGLIAMHHEQAALGESVFSLKITFTGRQRVRHWIGADGSEATHEATAFAKAKHL